MDLIPPVSGMFTAVLGFSHSFQAVLDFSHIFYHVLMFSTHSTHIPGMICNTPGNIVIFESIIYTDYINILKNILDVCDKIKLIIIQGHVTLKTLNIYKLASSKLEFSRSL